MRDSLRFLNSFHNSDRVAVLLIHQGLQKTHQKLTTTARARSDQFQVFLNRQNQRGFDVYLGMNPLKENSSGRTKADLAAIRHLYLDCDERGDEILDRVLDDCRLPSPHSVVQTSSNKWQIVWNVSGFTTEVAENVLRTLAREFGADPAATDATRVLRWPGFLNHRYQPPFRVRVTRYSAPVCWTADFAAFTPTNELVPRTSEAAGRRPREHAISQSERDWAWTLDQLKRGRSPQSIVSVLAERRGDKPAPLYYASRTVSRAVEEDARRRANA